MFHYEIKIPHKTTVPGFKLVFYFPKTSVSLTFATNKNSVSYLCTRIKMQFAQVAKL